MRKLSSGMTGFYKLVFGPLLIGMLLLLTIGSLVSSNPETRGSWLAFGGMLVLSSLFFGKTFLRARRVRLDGEDLVVSSFRRESRVPLGCVTRVTGSLWLTPELVFLQVEGCPEVGKSIVIMPPLRLFGGFSIHPLVGELRRLAKESRGRGGGTARVEDGKPSNGKPLEF